MDYKTHTKQRFMEKFVPMYAHWRKYKSNKINKQWLELTDDDYNNICEISRNEPLFFDKEKHKVIIEYNQTYMWCVISKKKKIIKTIYPIDKSDYHRYILPLYNNKSE